MKDLCCAACAHNFSAPKGRPFEPVTGYVAKYCDSDEPLDMVGATIWSVQYLGESGENIFPSLPADVLKRTLVRASSEEWLQPSGGDEVTVRALCLRNYYIRNPDPEIEISSTGK